MSSGKMLTRIRLYFLCVCCLTPSIVNLSRHNQDHAEEYILIGVDGDNNAVTDVIKDTVPRNIQYDRVRSNCHHVLMTWTGRSYSTLSRFSRRMPMQSQQLVTSLRQESRKDNEGLSTPSLG